MDKKSELQTVTPESDCVCGSKKQFKSCCGAHMKGHSQELGYFKRTEGIKVAFFIFDPISGATHTDEQGKVLVYKTRAQALGTLERLAEKAVRTNNISVMVVSGMTASVFEDFKREMPYTEAPSSVA